MLYLVYVHPLLFYSALGVWFQSEPHLPDFPQQGQFCGGTGQGSQGSAMPLAWKTGGSSPWLIGLEHRLPSFPMWATAVLLHNVKQHDSHPLSPSFHCPYFTEEAEPYTKAKSDTGALLSEQKCPLSSSFLVCNRVLLKLL